MMRVGWSEAGTIKLKSGHQERGSQEKKKKKNREKLTCSILCHCGRQYIFLHLHRAHSCPDIAVLKIKNKYTLEISHYS